PSLDELTQARGEAAAGNLESARRILHGDVTPTVPNHTLLPITADADTEEDRERLLYAVRSAVEGLAAMGVVVGFSLGPERDGDATLLAILSINSFIFESQLEILAQRPVRFRLRNPAGACDGEWALWDALIEAAVRDFLAGPRTIAWMAVI